MYYTLKQIDAKSLPQNSGTKVITIPRYARIKFFGTTSLDSSSNSWSQVDYYNKLGWIPSITLQENDTENEFCDMVYIDPSAIPTTYTTAKQYILVDKKLKYNLCGEFCVGYLGEHGILDFLADWKLKYPSDYSRIIGKDATTGISDLKNMLNSVDLTEYSDFSSIFATPQGNLSCPQIVQDKIDDGYKAIVGVKINGTGDVSDLGSTSHWVVLEDVDVKQRQNGIVRCYNPFANQVEFYSYREFVSSMTKFGNAVGLWVKI